MKWLLSIAVLLAQLSAPAYAAVEDIKEITVYKNPTGLSSGEWFFNLFKKSYYDKSYAVVVGVGDYEDSAHFGQLPADKDAENMRDYLLNEGGFDEVYFILNPTVKSRAIEKLMQNELPKKIKANDRFLFYWSGHGATRPSNSKPVGYLPFADSSADDYSSMLGMKALADWDDLIPAKQTLYLLDACFSGAAGWKSKGEAQDLTLEQIARPSRQILTAGGADEQAIAFDHGSLFTNAVLEGLRGAADFGSSAFPKDGIVSIKELEKHVRNRVAFERRKADWSKSITPSLTYLSDESRSGEFYFTSDKVVEMAKEEPAPLLSATNSDEATLSKAEHPPVTKPAQPPITLPQMIPIKGDSFDMGCKEGRDDVEGGCEADETILHTVKIADFAMSQTEITRGQFRTFVEATGYKTTAEQEGSCGGDKTGKGDWDYVQGNSWLKPGFEQTDEHPAVCISWDDTQAFITWLNQVDAGKNYRLPTEAEWEYAARGGNQKHAYPWWQDSSRELVCQKANLGDLNLKNHSPNWRWLIANCKDGHIYTAPVGQFSKNGYALLDMHGNVWEWVQDCYHDSYKGAPKDGSAWQEKDCETRVLRGGSWNSLPLYLRSASRNGNFPTDRNFNIGFRISRTL